MSSLALYRRYRPESFAEVIGQEHVTDPLQQALRNNRVNHAYLFSGPRGCGKTTSARILARCLNCEQGPTPTPCGECQSCRDLARNGPGSIDVIEIDAASHGGVDDARDLREKAFFGPASSRYKIYIIDEAHMVTSAGFNALLKVVEEPPEHLKFIFATTEPEKVIGTVRSRTHHYPFRLVPPGTLREYLAEVCGKENSPVEDGVLPLVVRAGAGSVRDSMSVMDQLLAGAGDDGVTYAMATSLLGYTDGSLLDSIVDAFAAGDGAAAFEVVDRVIEGGNDPRRFVADLLERLRDLVILAAVPDAREKGLIDAPADVVERMQAQASVFGAAELSRAADLVNEGLTEMRGATSPRLQVELICARVLLPAAFDDERSLQARLDRLERGASFATTGPGPAMGYVPGPEALAHAPVPPAPAAPVVQPGTGPAVARAAVRGEAPAPAPAQAAPPAPAPVQAPQPAAPAAPQPPAEAAPATAGGQRPGAWPTAAAPESGRRPGGWPTASAPGQSPVSQSAPAAAPAQAAPSAPVPAVAEPSPGMTQGAGQVRNMWPDILEAVKNRRRFTWILLSQNAQVTGFDGTTLQIGFLNAGARDNFASSGSEEVLRQALAERFNAQWKIEAVVDPSGGTGAPAQTGGGRPAAPPAQQYQAPAPQQGYEPRPAASPQQQHQQQQQAQSSHQQQPGAASAAEPAPQSYSAPPQQQYSAPEPPRAVAPEDDTPEADDPDLVDSALSGHDLIVRELGATVVEEFTNE
ncbi:DNA polymerase III subunit gamma and tau [Streptomyces sp. NBC_00257]|uniref:DNA polymerase III subunit gamma and tau n=2 Tax=Streptomyces TaxID=1883 RepID=UPI00225003D1|nr:MULTISPECIES: DNA polymerase III subunit gamma and tau [unclassified Streptomyces]MCX4865701.1 DNA polymerase III subunit gamma and tau [Streptomyces sp. NBC_00906]MCX4896940.1 DNA polymerase III subunit gamma and tau [Streptomyces sp. NBC_00892]MCX5430222.1 DNA polymerase III subunit gamma and tau [Streptomyces sp. NBC_00062]